jgi:hypothetical protein
LERPTRSPPERAIPGENPDAHDIIRPRLNYFFISILIGSVGLGIWSLLSFVFSRDVPEFRSLFFSGVANLLFFFLLYIALASHLERPTKRAPVRDPSIISNGALAVFDLPSIFYFAVAITVGMLLLNILANGFINALNRLESIKSASFTAEGYRDIQIYFGGVLGLGGLAFLCLYSFHLGYIRPTVSLVSVFIGVALPIFLQGLLYVSLGFFLDYQIFKILTVTPPEV